MYDLGKFCWQVDDDSVWFLKQIDPPLWAQIQGGGGSGGDKNYRHDQATPTRDVTITHSLAKEASCQLYDRVSLTQILGEITWIDANSVRVRFAVDTAFVAVFN
jgi:hypothetical protein